MGISGRIKPYSILGLDTPVFIYHLESHPAYSPITLELFSKIEGGDHEGITSAITLMEINVRPIQIGRWDIARKYEALLASFPHLTIVEVNREVARQAAQLRAEYRIRPADALQVAACWVNGAQVLITNDRRLECLRPEMDILVLDDLRY